MRDEPEIYGITNLAPGATDDIAAPDVDVDGLMSDGYSTLLMLPS